MAILYSLWLASLVISATDSLRPEQHELAVQLRYQRGLGLSPSDADCKVTHVAEWRKVQTCILIWNGEHQHNSNSSTAHMYKCMKGIDEA